LPENLKNLRNQIKEVDFPLMTNTLLLDIFQVSKFAKSQFENKPFEKTPIWLIKSSGRYLPEFLELRKSKAYFDVIILKFLLLIFFLK